MEERPEAIPADELFRILELLEESDWDEIELTTKDFKFRAGKQLSPDCATPASSCEPRTETKLNNKEVGTGRQAEAKSSDIAENVTELNQPAIRAPMVGMFYTSPSPGAPPYVRVGDLVTEQSIVGIIEVMKVMKSIEAGLVGRISAVLIENGQFVEYGKPLFLVGPTD
jgi:acetyl-CoA carboxylase biotin carboxyl carrier protein